MRKKVVLAATVLFVSLALFLWPSPATGAGPGTKPVLVFRFFGGLGYQTIGDINTGLKGFSDAAIHELGLGAAGGGYAEAHYGFDAGGDVLFQFGPHFGLGIGAGYLRTKRASRLNLMPADPALHDEVITFSPVVSAVPFRLSAFAFVPLGGAVRLSLNIGPEWYLASARTEIMDNFPGWWWNQRENKVKGSGIGLHGGVGLELRLSEGLSFLLEGQGRLAKIDELTGTRRYWNSFGFEEAEEGTLYAWTDLWTFAPFPLVGVHATAPSDPWVRDVRKAVLDLSGWSVVAGFVVRI